MQHKLACPLFGRTGSLIFEKRNAAGIAEVEQAYVNPYPVL
jgi:hypothetical protein